ncbi:hypothetical protein Goari_014298 [Gossypium aridum]|uniref:Uncharacterized protein n=1 Tax=Gossypium aridum TaxID=34290 RepID=A0A7J8XHY8_GOSAI|nr:hypothetical protein [Gossypium aridum]
MQIQILFLSKYFRMPNVFPLKKLSL